MRLARAAALVAVVLLWLALGPLVLLAAVASLAHPRVRGWLRPSRRVVGASVAALLVVSGVAWVVPDGWLPIPPAGGAWVTPGYVGRPWPVRPLDGPEGPGSTDAVGPSGLSLEVDTAWYGLDHCTGLLVDGSDRIVGTCRSRRSTRLVVVDPDSLDPVASKTLPAPCADPQPVLDAAGRVLVATADRTLLEVATADAEGEPDLTTTGSTDLTGVVPQGDCVVSVAVDPAGRVWWASRDGLVGWVTGDGPSGPLDLGEEVEAPLAVDADGALVRTVEALHRVVRVDGEPVSAWRSAYDTGNGTKPGGSGPTLLPGGLVALVDDANPRAHVVVRRLADGSEVCRAEVFEDDSSASGSALVPVGQHGLVVVDNGWTGPGRVILGRRPPGGVARIDLDPGLGADGCGVTWTSDAVSPSSGATLSRATGLLYLWTKRKSWLGVDAWYLTALDARTGRLAWSVRGVRGWVGDDARTGVLLGPDEAAYVGVRGGLVRVRDGR